MWSSIGSLIQTQDSNAQLSITTQDRIERNTQADIIFLCVKPQQFASLDLSVYDTNMTCVSIMNGIRTDGIGHFHHIIRTMPNLFGEVNQGITGWYEKGNCADSIRQYVQKIFTNSGIIVQLQEEIDFSAFTAFAGCGPAVVAYIEQYCGDHNRAQIYEDMRKAGIALWLSDAHVAMIISKLRSWLPLYLAKHTIGHEELIDKVSSKWWSTEAIIDYFRIHQLDRLLQEPYTDAIATIIAQGILQWKMRADALAQ